MLLFLFSIFARVSIMNERKSRVKFYEQLITRTLNTSVGETTNLEPAAPTKKKRLKKTSNKNRLSTLELVIGIYHFLMLDARKYAHKWNFSSLISLLETQPVDTDPDGQLVRWFVVKICALLLNLTPVQESDLFRVYFKSEPVLEQCSLR